jgi:L-rhamnose mutarotase
LRKINDLGSYIIEKSKRMEIICEIMRLKEDKIKVYVDMHLNPWPELIKATKNAGIVEQYCFINGNIVVVITKAEDIDEATTKLSKTKIYKKWTTLVRNMLILNNNINLSKIDVVRARCIFNLTELLKI